MRYGAAGEADISARRKGGGAYSQAIGFQSQDHKRRSPYPTEMRGKSIEYDPKMLEKGRWTVDGRLFWPPEHQITYQSEPLPEQLELLLAGPGKLN
jgi:hypothetical protein